MSSDVGASALALQEADSQLLQLQAKLEELPQRQQIADTQQKHSEFQAKAAQVAQMRKKSQAQIKLLQDEQASLAERMAAAQAEIDKAHDYKQTQALSREIDGFAKMTAKLEDDELAEMEKLEKLKSVEQQLAQALEKLAAQEQRLTDGYRQQGSAINKAIAAEQLKREQLAASLPETLVKRYEKALTAKSGIAVAYLEDSHCSACRVNFSEGQLLNLRQPAADAGAKEGAHWGISECPHCHRLLVVTA